MLEVGECKDNVKKQAEGETQTVHKVSQREEITEMKHMKDYHKTTAQSLHIRRYWHDCDRPYEVYKHKILKEKKENMAGNTHKREISTDILE